MDKKTTSRLLAVIILIGIFAMGFIYLNYSGHPSANTVLVSRGDITEGIPFSGIVRAQRQANLGFGSAYPATITKLFTKVGDTVMAGVMIAQLENADVQAQYDQALAGVSSSRLLLDELSSSVKMEKLKLKDLSSNPKKVQQAQVTVTEKSVEVQKAILIGAQAGLRNAQAQLAKMTIRAPFDGVVAKQDVEIGDLVAPGVPIVTLISDKDTFQIETFVSDQDITKITLGDTADVTLDAYGNAVVFKARVATIDLDKTIQNGVSTYRVTFVFYDNDARIKSGMSANIFLVVRENKDVIEIPRTSIMSREGKQFVLVLKDGARQEKEVSTGISGIDGMMEIVSGLSEGELVIK